MKVVDSLDKSVDSHFAICINLRNILWTSVHQPRDDDHDPGQISTSS